MRQSRCGAGTGNAPRAPTPQAGVRGVFPFGSVQPSFGRNQRRGLNMRNGFCFRKPH